MRPSRPRESPARLKTQLSAHVAWLRGVPLAVNGSTIEWLVLRAHEEAHTIQVDGALLSETTRCVHELMRERELLARVVGDPERWKTRVLAAVARLKPALHGSGLLDGAVADMVAALPAGDARRAKAALGRPEQRRLVEWVLWSHALDPEPIRAALTAVEAHAEVLSGQDPVAVLGALHVACEDGARADALFALLEEALETGPPICDRASFLELFPVSTAPTPEPLLVRPAKAATASQPKQQRALSELLGWLRRSETKARRAALSLIAASVPLGMLREWRAAHEELAVIDAALRKRKQWSSAAPAVSRLRALRQRLPPTCDLSAWIDAVRVLAGHPELVGPLEDLLSALPSEASLRTLAHWADLVPTLDEPQRRIVGPYLRALAVYAANAAEGRLAPWAPLSERDRPLRRWDTPDVELLESLRGPSEVRWMFAALEVSTSLDVTLIARLLAVSAVAPKLAAERIDALVKRDDGVWRSPDALRVASELEPETADEWASLVISLAGPRVAGSWSKHGQLAAMHPATRASLRRTLVDGPHLVARAAHLIAIADDVPELARPPRTRPRWIERYPSALHDALTGLHRHPDVAARILDADFPSEQALRTEIATLEGRDALGPSLARRLESLRGRLVSPRIPSARRLANLAAKLEGASDRLLWEEWSGRLLDACARTIGRLLGTCPEWALDDANLAVIAAALDLEPADRDVALRVLRVRSGPPPWDLRDAPENVAAMQSLRARGIDPRPWVEGIGSLERVGPDGARVFLALEDDPLEVFQMGERFGTCLSVGASNFFSVFANAADIDKRVIYARDGAKKPLARCLLALTDDGHLLTFHPYAHVSPDTYGRMFAEFASALANEMGAVCAPRGRVRPRVAKHWYDDGPRDLVGQFPFLEPMSPFWQAFFESPPEAVVALTAAAFAPRPLDGLTIPLVLSKLSETTRPDLALPFLDLLEAEALPLSDSLRITAVRHAYDAGQKARARALAGTALAAAIEGAFLRDADHFDMSLVHLQLDVDPAALLRVMRRVARRVCRDEWADKRRRYFASMALERLGRPRRALDLLRELPDGVAPKGEINAAIRRIEAGLRNG